MNMKLMASEKYFSRTFLIRKPSPLVNKHRAIAHKKRSQQPVIGEGRWGSSLHSSILPTTFVPGGGGVLDEILDGDVPSKPQKHTRSLYQFSKMYSRFYTNSSKIYTQPNSNFPKMHQYRSLYQNCEN